MRLNPVVPEEISKIKKWIEADPFHKDDLRNQPEYLLTGSGGFCFSLSDDKGVICYSRLDKEDDMVRLSTQFGPEEEVSKKRLVTGLLSFGIPAIIRYAKDGGYKGIVFESESYSLISFMDKLGFKSVGGKDYALVF